MVTVLFFGPLAELTATHSITLPDCTSTTDLHQRLLLQFPLLADKKFAVAVNKELVQEDVALTAGSEVAILPPFSGG